MITDKQYADFIESEGKKIARLIDAGKSYKQVNEALSNDHSGYTFGLAMAYGIGRAKDKLKAEKIRLVHNRKFGIKDSAQKGVVNPAMFRIG